MSAQQRTVLASLIREFLVEQTAKRGGHLGPNLGVVELTMALHMVFDSPRDPILFDTGHQAYVHKILTGRADRFDALRTRDGLSGYPSRAESEHDWIENSHASTSLSYADGLAKALALRHESDRTVVALIGDGALTGGMAWEALNNIAGAPQRPLVIVLNDNGRSYAPTTGGMAQRMAALRLRPSYERMLGRVKDTLPKAPVVGRPMYSALHAAKSAVKDWFVPQTMFADLGLKYLGPIDGHDVEALQTALRAARDFRGAVLVHCVTRKGEGYEPAESDDAEQMHSPPAFDPSTGKPTAASAITWTHVFGREMVVAGAERPNVVAITAAMSGPTGLTPFATAFPDRLFDVGIAEQHAMTSAAGLAMGGMHPVVAIYATFLNRAFDQLLMDCALHRLGVTVVLDRAGITGEDGPSHHGMWDMSLAAMIPGLRMAAPRDAATLAEELSEALNVTDGPTVLRFPKGAVPTAVPALRRFRLLPEGGNAAEVLDSAAGVDILAEPPQGQDNDVLLLAVGAFGALAVEAAARLAQQGIGVTVVDPRWALPVPAEITALAVQHRLVVTVEDGGRSGGVGAAVTDALSSTGVPVQVLAIPQRFVEPAPRAELLADLGLTAQSVARGITEEIARSTSEGSTSEGSTSEGSTGERSTGARSSHERGTDGRGTNEGDIDGRGTDGRGAYERETQEGGAGADRLAGDRDTGAAG